ncbi:hypothetical protein BEWA_006540 [Theileria equi strain WA]|uniref:Uncharacterized protein n=1 Tax=Theileria equi strain WA TaxID=1537102 RepID=L0B097_THEEQ|nr:hypothetical protein BEWA_006540 [Theileria equi strain WA]AFZ81245.1 hypothetical protein BEWA_006540 [Theileria equi strain WA]|eukprot:XP_004830911.1 hypothetical protein BEWA_006540 [Theileria equi strain WA]
MPSPTSGVTINIREKPTDNENLPYIYGSDQVRLERGENPPGSGFLMFKHTSPNGQPFQVDKVMFGDAQVSDIGVNYGDKIDHLAVWYWRETLETMTNPLLAEVFRNGSYTYNYNKGGMETSWTSLPIIQNPRPIPLHNKDLETQLDGLNCYLNDAVTLNLTFENSSKLSNNSARGKNTYCCITHSPNATSGRVSVEKVKVSCKQNPNHRSADCYKHEFTPSNGWRLAAIKYDPTGGSTRNRINLNGHKSPPSVTTVYAFYKDNNPKLIYVEGNEENKWFKSPTGGNSNDENWEKVLTDLQGIKPTNFNSLTCNQWSKLKEALTEAGCGSLPKCPQEHSQSSFRLSAGGGSPSTPPGPQGPSGIDGYRGDTVEKGTQDTKSLQEQEQQQRTKESEELRQEVKEAEGEGSEKEKLKKKEEEDGVQVTNGDQTGSTESSSPEQGAAEGDPDGPGRGGDGTAAEFGTGAAEAGIFATIGYFIAGTTGSGAAGFLGYKGYKLYQNFKGDPWVRQI